MQRTRWLSMCLGITLVATLWLAAKVTRGQEVISSERAREAVTVREVSADGDFISGVVVNNTSRTLRDVRLEIQHAWLWRDERNPGSDNPGRTDYYTVPGDIAPGASERFTYKISPPLPVRSDGTFRTSAAVVGFSEVGR